MSKPGAYLYCTYRRLVDQTLLETINSRYVDDSVLNQIPFDEHTEEILINALAQAQTVASMDLKGREIVKRLMLGYEVPELATREGQSPAYIRKRLRRSIDRAVRRMMTRSRR